VANAASSSEARIVERARWGDTYRDMSMLLVEAGQSGLCIYDERVRRISTGHRCRSRPLPFVVRMRTAKGAATTTGGSIQEVPACADRRQVTLRRGDAGGKAGAAGVLRRLHAR